LKAQAATIATSHAEVTGTYTSSQSLVISTNYAPINANITLIDALVDDRAVSATLATDHAHIKSFINLEAEKNDDDEHGNPQYKIVAASSEGSLDLAVLKQPVDSDLHFTGATKNAPINVKLAPAFEGPFSLITTRGSRADVNADPHVEDPAGEDRERIVNVKNFYGFITGSVKWVKKNEGTKMENSLPRWDDLSKVTLATSNGDIALNL
jgi:hypothetical protein